MHESNQTSNKTPKGSGKINHLVSLLPEIYQPIYKHPKLSQNVSRGCEDRLSHLVAVHNALREKLNHPVRVLDLGCAQGFFSLNLAALGARVHGIDSLDKNIAVCQALADESAGIQASFETGRVEEIIATLLPDQFDLVLGLSFFHHLIHEHGLSSVQHLLTKLAQTVPVGIFEVALRSEPLYWGPSQPEDPAQMLQDYAFVHELAEHQTHLSEVKRPLYFASNRLWYLNNQIGYFESIQSESHQYAHGTHQGTRLYYFGEDRIVKIFRMNVTERQSLNLKEHQNEVSFLLDPPAGFSAPKLILHGKNKKELWLVRDQLEGRLLVDYFETATPYDHEKVIGDILQQLVMLEQAGLYHNDVRCWNVLLSPEKRASLVDYGAISSECKDCVWPYDLLMAFIIFIREVVSRKTAYPDPIRKPWLDIGVLPAIYSNAFLKLLATPKSLWSFSYLQQCITQTDNPQSLDPVNLADGFFALLSTMENAAFVYEEAVHHWQDTNKKEQAHGQWLHTEWDAAKAKDKEMEARAQEAEVRAQGLETRATEAEARAQGLETRATEAEARAQGLEARAQDAEAVLNAVYNSRSWRITAPLRGVSRSAKGIIKSFKDVTKSLAHRILAIGLQGVRAVPPLKRVLLSVARRFPSVGAPFLSLAAAHPRPLMRILRATRRKPAVTQTHHIPLRTQRSLTAAPTKTKRVLYYYVDHTIGCPVNTGMQRVTRGLARGLIETGEDVVFVRWSPEAKALVKINRDQLKHLCEWQGPIMSPQMTAAYPAPDAPDEPIGNHDCNDSSWLVVPEVTYINFHGYAPTLDVLMTAKEAKLKTAFIFYDAIPLRCDEFASIAPLHAEYMQHLLLVDLVVPISRWSARDLVSFFVHHEKSELTAIPVVEPLLLPGETRLTEGFVKSPVVTQKIILSVGTIERRKNQGVLLEAFEAFCSRHPGADWKLVLVGNLHQNMADEVNSAVARNKMIVYRGNISDADLDELYRSCTFTVFPSKGEGFGLPIAESLDYGKPCICANFGAMAEVASGGGCLAVDVRDAGTIERAIATLSGNLDELRRLEQEAVAIKSVTWSDYTKDFCALIDRATKPGNKIGKIFYWVGQTCIFPFNTGIQRVARGLARALIENGLDLVPVKWDIATGFFVSPTNLELLHFAQWNGPAPDDWTSWDAKTFEPSDWLLIPEVISAPSGPSITAISAKAHACGLRSASIFFDAIPWKMRDIYPPQATEAHCDYMRALNNSDLIFSISEHSYEDLSKFLRSQPFLHTPNLFERLRVALLPGEFLETPRNTEIKLACETVRILCVGTVEPRKNHLTLLEAFAMVQTRAPIDKRVELTIVGVAPFPDLEKKVQSVVQSIPGVRWELKINDSHLRELYHSSDFTVYPSLEEGFGLPILESLWHARPCICRDASSMLEIGEGGGCLMVDTTDADALASGIMQLITDEGLRLKLAQEAVSRPFKKWCDYADEIVQSLSEERVVPLKKSSAVTENESQFRANMVNLEIRPLLSICITTYNRAEWLALSLKNIARLMPAPIPGVEIVVCDNTSTDHTPDVVKPYEGRSDFHYYRNPSNVGMLGNLRVTAHHSRGQYVWILGDDDLVAPGAIEKVLASISQNPDAALVYLNYAYTREEDAKRITDLVVFFANATPITKPTHDLVAPISRLSTLSENFFTAIYCLVFRRDHALRAYTQDTSGRPFSTMVNCIPTTYHVLNNMMHEKGIWLGTPQVVVNMNVSWLKYASIWILERIPEAFDLAEKMGALRKEIDERRIAHLPNIWQWFGEILNDDPEGNAVYFNPARFFSRFKHLREFQVRAPELIKAYREAHLAHPTRFPLPPEDLFSTSPPKERSIRRKQ